MDAGDGGDELTGEFLPYEQMPDESPHQWRSFVLFRDAGPTRRLGAVAKALGQAPSYIRLQSYKNNWQARCRAWDREVDRVHREAMLQAQRDILTEHRALASAMRQKAAAAVANTTCLEEENIVRWVTAAVKIEQQAYGMSPSNAVGPATDQEKTPEEVYFDGISSLKILRLGKEAITALEREVENAAKGSSGHFETAR